MTTNETILFDGNGSIVVIDVDGSKTSWEVVTDVVLNAEKETDEFMTADELLAMVDGDTRGYRSQQRQSLDIEDCFGFGWTKGLDLDRFLD